jgi:hypothetical protein
LKKFLFFLKTHAVPKIKRAAAVPFGITAALLYATLKALMKTSN